MAGGSLTQNRPNFENFSKLFSLHSRIPKPWDRSSCRSAIVFDQKLFLGATKSTVTEELQENKHTSFAEKGYSSTSMVATTAAFFLTLPSMFSGARQTTTCFETLLGKGQGSP